MNVCESIIEVLHQHGVEYIFGVPGDAINDLIDAIRKQDKIKFIHVMHEEAGAFAAAAQAKLSGKLAVCAGTAGPGAIHLLNGLYDANKDHAPVLAITGQAATDMLGSNYQQEINLLGLFNDVTVYNQALVDPGQMPNIIMQACQSAITLRGVAHINIPSNVSGMRVKAHGEENIHDKQNSLLLPLDTDLQLAANLINKAEKPCILAGIGARDAVNELVQFAEIVRAPIIKALRGKDILPDLHPLTTGGIGLLGTSASYKAMKDCDLLITVGSDFPYSEFYPDKDVPVIQVDNNAQRIGRRHPAKVALVGDSTLSLRELLKLVQKKNNDAFLKECQQHRQRDLEKEEKKELADAVPIHPQALARLVSDFASDDAVICCDTGEVTVWGARNFRLKGTQRFTLSGGLASMAFGLPAAIGAQLLYPGRQVIALCGDGGFAMLMCDFATAVKYKLNIKVFIFNNSKLGLIKMEEEARSGNPEWETDLHNPDYAAYALSCGGEGFTVKNTQELRSAIPAVLATPKPCIVNVMIDPNELTMPPKVNIAEAFNYVKAKIKEAME